MRALASHLARRHGMSTEQYREAHGIARTTPLVSRATAETMSDAGRRRRDQDPRVLRAMDGPGAAQQRRQPFPQRPRRPATLAANRAASARAQHDRWTQALAHAGWTSWEQAAAWARAENLGWAAIARRMGTSQTPTRRQGEAAGIMLDRALVVRSAAMLAAARAHADEHGDLTGTTGDLARWLTARRYAATGGDIDQVLDALDPGWRDRRRR